MCTAPQLLICLGIVMLPLSGSPGAIESCDPQAGGHAAHGTAEATFAHHEDETVHETSPDDTSPDCGCCNMCSASCPSGGGCVTLAVLSATPTPDVSASGLRGGRDVLRQTPPRSLPFRPPIASR